MIIFSDRRKLEDLFSQWLESTENFDASNFNLITFLDLFNLLDEEKVLKFLEDNKD